LIYGLTIPLFSPVFFEDYQLVVFLMMGCCLILSMLFYSGVAPLINILISFFIFKLYLIRPYVDIFSEKLTAEQLRSVAWNNSYFNYEDAITVYLQLFLIISAWFLGLLLIKPKKNGKASYPIIFKKFDNIISSLNWRFWFIFLCLAFLSYQDPREMWQGTIEGGGKGLFAYGLLQTEIVSFVLMAYFIIQKNDNKDVSWLLLLPILLSSVSGVFSGGRGALYGVFIFLFIYLLYLNFNKILTHKDFKKMLVFMSFIPVVILTGLAAQIIRSVIKANLEVDAEVYWGLIAKNINIFDPDNPLVNTVYYGLTQLLYRLSALQEKFLILGNHYINDPSLLFNFMSSFQRVINDLLPGSLFLDQPNINQLYHHIYFDEYINYASHMWGLQGTLYLYFGYYVPILLIFFLGLFYRLKEEKINFLLKQSPSFLVFFIFLINDLMENGTLERVIPVDIVRPLTTFIFFILAVKILYVLFPEKKKVI